MTGQQSQPSPLSSEEELYLKDRILQKLRERAGDKEMLIAELEVRLNVAGEQILMLQQEIAELKKQNELLAGRVEEQ